MKKTVSAMTWIRSTAMALVLLLSFAPWSSVVALAATPPQLQPNYGTLTIDGTTSGWNLPVDFFADLYQSGDASNFPDPLAELYLRYNCSSQTMYALVLAASPVRIDASGSPDQYAADINGATVADGSSADFTWVNLSNGLADGWEVSFPINIANAQNFTLRVSTLAWDGASQTAATSLADTSIPLVLICHDKGDLPEDDILDPSGGVLVYGYHMTLVGTGNGAYHDIRDLRLGSQIDGEVDGQPNQTATGDDQNVRADEDGVQRVANPPDFWSNGVGEVKVTVNGGQGCLWGWMDFWSSYTGSVGTDGDFNDTGTVNGKPWSENIISNHPMGNSDGSTYTENITFTLPLQAGTTPVYARFRLVPANSDGSCTTALAPTGYGGPGEVEDYRWDFNATAVTLKSFSAGAPASTQSTALWLVLPLLGATLVTLFWKNRRRFSS